MERSTILGISCNFTTKSQPLYFIYNTALAISTLGIRIAAFFNKKMAAFHRGRKGVFNKLRDELDGQKPTVWMHAASLGEYEQGLPVLKKLQEAYPSYQYLVTFFSPSGYEVISKKSPPFILSYLPLDTPSNVKEFLRIVNPRIALFVKYEIWPNYFRQLEQLEIPLFIIAARFYKRQAFFRTYGGFLRESLKKVTHFFVQDQQSASLLNDLGHRNISITGDTRFDRVLELEAVDFDRPGIEKFSAGTPCLVAGSTWPEDEAVIIPAVNDSELDFKTIIAPHNIEPEHLRKLQSSIEKKTCLFSVASATDLEGAEVLILDTVGHLSRIYRYGDLAYVGGGFATGLHNTLEPAVYRLPVITGPEYTEFTEVEDLVEAGGVIAVNNAEEFREKLALLLENRELRAALGARNREYIDKKSGASVRIINNLRTYL